MLTFVVVIHIIVALVLIVMVLLQDSKGGAMGGAFGGGSSSNSLLGATGSANLLTQLTRYAAIVFAVTSIVLTTMTAQKPDSVIDDYVAPQEAELSAPADTNSAQEATGPQTSEVAPEAAPTEAPTEGK